MFDLVTVGEMLIDLISEQRDAGLASAERFGATLGGSPTNTAVVASLLGGRVAAVGCVGHGGFGDKIERRLESAGVESHVQRAAATSTIALVSRSTTTPEFVIVRGADRMLLRFEVPPTRWLHTSLFALSEDPLRSSVLDVLPTFDGPISLDANYDGSIWHGRDVAETLEGLGGMVGVLKASADDCHRMFGDDSVDGWIGRLLDFGFGTVLFTHGAKAVMLASDGELAEIPVPRRDVSDVTGAGDAFMAGVIMARLDGYGWRDAVAIGIEVAGRSVEVMGHLPGTLDREQIYAAAVA